MGRHGIDTADLAGHRMFRSGMVLVVALSLVALPGLVVPAHADEVSVREAQALLNELGYPAGPVDGVDGPQTRRGICAWRRLAGDEAHRGPLTGDELARLREADRLPEAPEGRGVTVDKTCQTLYFRADGHWQRAFAASTGSGGLPRVGAYTVNRRRAGWHTSTLYPAAQPNMYNSLYFHGVIAIHGSHDVRARPVSAGCVRVTPSAADFLFERIENGDAVEVIGSY